MSMDDIFSMFGDIFGGRGGFSGASADSEDSEAEAPNNAGIAEAIFA